ncbi:MAG: hypothetical protein ACE5FO_09920 [Parvularculaceae bacterium]
MANEFPVRGRVSEIRITLAVGAAILVQTALALIWAGAAAERIAQLERRADDTSQLIERTARLEEQVRSVRVTVDRIEDKLDRIGTEGRR